MFIAPRPWSRGQPRRCLCAGAPGTWPCRREQPAACSAGGSPRLPGKARAPAAPPPAAAGTAQTPSAHGWPQPPATASAARAALPRPLWHHTQPTRCWGTAISLLLAGPRLAQPVPGHGELRRWVATLWGLPWSVSVAEQAHARWHSGLRCDAPALAGFVPRMVCM